MRYHQLRQISAKVNKKPGPDASLRKALKDPHGKRVFTLAKDMMGAEGMLAIGDLDPSWDPWAAGFLFSPALTVGGGTAEVLRNIIAERCSASLTTPTSTRASRGLRRIVRLDQSPGCPLQLASDEREVVAPVGPGHERRIPDVAEHGEDVGPQVRRQVHQDRVAQGPDLPLHLERALLDAAVG